MTNDSEKETAHSGGGEKKEGLKFLPPNLYILNTPNRVSGIGALSIAAKP
jgi:hypothetical protein